MGQEMRRALRWHDYITININWFALTTRSQVLTPLMIPLLVQRFVGDAAKGTYVGTMRLWALMAALLFQAFMGILSDRSTSRWGRRRPFVIAGTLGEITVFALIGWSAGLEGMDGYWVLFGLFIFSMLTSNTSQAATQGFIPDLVPDEKKGTFSGIKAALELPIPLIFVSVVIAPMIAKDDLWGALTILMGVLFICMLVTLFVREMPLQDKPGPIDWRPLARLLLMTAAFTSLILAIGWVVKWLIRWSAGSSVGASNAILSIAGLTGMVLAVGIGVWISTRLSLGEAARRRRSYRWWVINRLAFLVAANNLASFMVFFLQEKFPAFAAERAAGPAAQIIMFVGVFILVSALPGGWLTNRFGSKKMLVASGLLGAGGTAIVVLAPDLQVIFIGACLIGAAVGTFYAVNWALGTMIVPKEQAAQYLGIANLAGAGAGAVGAYIGGPIADANGYVLLMSIYGALFLASIFALWGIEGS